MTQILTILWPSLCAGIIIFCVAFWKMREKIPFERREKIEKVLIVIAIIILLVDIGFSINARRITAEEINDCIRFYHSYPTADDSNYYFTSLCHSYFGENGTIQLRQEGVSLNSSSVILPNNLNITVPG
jgi:hypothetical protein